MGSLLAGGAGLQCPHLSWDRGTCCEGALGVGLLVSSPMQEGIGTPQEMRWVLVVGADCLSFAPQDHSHLLYSTIPRMQDPGQIVEETYTMEEDPEGAMSVVSVETSDDGTTRRTETTVQAWGERGGDRALGRNPMTRVSASLPRYELKWVRICLEKVLGRSGTLGTQECGGFPDGSMSCIHPPR